MHRLAWEISERSFEVSLFSVFVRVWARAGGPAQAGGSRVAESPGSREGFENTTKKDAFIGPFGNQNPFQIYLTDKLNNIPQSYKFKIFSAFNNGTNSSLNFPSNFYTGSPDNYWYGNGTRHTRRTGSGFDWCIFKTRYKTKVWQKRQKWVKVT